jgi:hypothetical protein
MERNNSRIDFSKLISIPTPGVYPDWKWTGKRKRQIFGIIRHSNTILLSMSGDLVLSIHHSQIPKLMANMEVIPKAFLIDANIIIANESKLYIASYDVWVRTDVLMDTTLVTPEHFSNQRQVCAFLRYKTQQIMDSGVYIQRDVEQETSVRLQRDHGYHQRFILKQMYLSEWIQNIDKQALTNTHTRHVNNPLITGIDERALCYNYTLDNLTTVSSNLHHWVNQIGGIVNHSNSIQEFIKAITTVDRDVVHIEPSPMCQKRLFLSMTSLIIIHPWSIPVWEKELKKENQSYVVILDRDAYNRIPAKTYTEVKFVIVSELFTSSAYYKKHYKKDFPMDLTKAYMVGGGETSVLCKMLLEQHPSKHSTDVYNVLQQTPFHIFSWRRVVYAGKIQTDITAMVYWSVSDSIYTQSIQDLLRFCYGATLNKSQHLLDFSWCSDLLNSCIFDCRPNIFDICVDTKIPSFDIYQHVEMRAFSFEKILLDHLTVDVSDHDMLSFWIDPQSICLDTLHMQRTSEFIRDLRKTSDTREVHESLKRLRDLVETLDNLNNLIGNHRDLTFFKQTYGRLCEMLDMPQDLTTSMDISESDDKINVLLEKQYGMMHSAAEITLASITVQITEFVTTNKRNTYLISSASQYESSPGTCPICMTNTANVIIECGHLFCRYCIVKIFSRNKGCAICKYYFEDMIKLIGNTEEETDIRKDYKNTALLTKLQKEITNDDRPLLIITQSHKLVRQLTKVLGVNLRSKGYMGVIITPWTQKLPTLPTLQQTDVLITSAQVRESIIPDHIPRFCRVYFIFSDGERWNRPILSQTKALIGLVHACGPSVKLTDLYVRCVLADAEEEIDLLE